MNASSRKVLRECLVGIIITEPRRERGKIRRRRGTGMKRVLGRRGIEEAIEQQWFRFRINAQSIQQVSRSYRGYRSFLDRSTRYQGGVEIAFKKMLEKLDRWQGIKEVSSKLLKPVFREVKNTDIYAIQHTTQPMIQSTQKSLKIVSQFKKNEHKDLQNTHTH